MTQKYFNPAYDQVTIFDAKGTPHICSRLNALELVGPRGYSWAIPEGFTAPEAPKTETAAIVEPEPTKEVVAAVVEEVAATPIDHDSDPLAAIAQTIAGTDVPKYLASFTADALRTMADKRYGETLHPRMGSDKLIDKIIELEAVKTAAELDA